jgi:hypothetical protein
MLHKEWKFICFYGDLDATKRIEAWNLLKILAQLHPDPWVCIGDFNEILSMSEKCGGILLQNSPMKAFQRTLDDCTLTNLGFFGPKFIWSNGQEGDALVRERLDHGMANLAWCSIFPDA